MSENLKRQDYRECIWDKGQWILAVVKSGGVVVVLAFFFYRSIFAVIPLSVVGILYFRMLKRKQMEACRQQLLSEFKEYISSVATALRAGYAVENAFIEGAKDCRMLWGKQSIMVREMELIRRGLVINITLEELIKDLAERSNCKEIHQFAEVLVIAKRHGGTLPGIISRSAEIIGHNIETKQEIGILLSGRKMEQRIMRVMPFGILTYIGITYSGYFDTLYHNWQGGVIMTICLGLYFAAYVMGDKILLRIEMELTG